MIRLRACKSPSPLVCLAGSSNSLTMAAAQQLAEFKREHGLAALRREGHGPGCEKLEEGARSRSRFQR